MIFKSILRCFNHVGMSFSTDTILSCDLEYNNMLTMNYKKFMREYYGPLAEGTPKVLVLRHDHGPQYMSRHFQGEIAFLRIESSPSVVKAPEGNGGSRTIHSHAQGVVRKASYQSQISKGSFAALKDMLRDEYRFLDRILELKNV